MTAKEVEDFVYNYPTKHKEGFIVSEITELVAKFPEITLDEFHDKLGVNTCIVKDGDWITFSCDIATALICCVEKRNKNTWEWD